MKDNYKKPSVKSLSDPTLGFPSLIQAGIALYNAATTLKKAIGDDLNFVKVRSLVDSKGDSKKSSF